MPELVGTYLESVRVARPGAAVLVVHWRYDPGTPQGPSMDIRPRPERIVEWAAETGLLKVGGPAIDLPPWHYGLRLKRKAARD